jgi:KaiC/GvpD/RAD55 family RecA-like ATPase
MIPEKLQEFRFVKVEKNRKKPLEKEWQIKNNYSVDDLELINYVKRGGNVGVVLGRKKGLVVLDFDEVEFFKKWENKLPETFTIKSAKKKLPHYYYYSEDVKTFKILNEEKKNLFDFLGRGAQALIPPSKVDGGKYEVLNDSPIAWLPSEVLIELKKLSSKDDEKDELNWDDLNEVTLSREDQEIVKKADLKIYLERFGFNTSKNPTKCIWHDMTGQGNFSFNLNKKVWHCFHCGKGGNIIHLYTYYHDISKEEAKKKLKEELGLSPQINFDGFLSAKKIMTLDVPEVEWIINGLIPKRNVTILGGDNGSFKSFLALHLCLSMATNTAFLNEYDCDTDGDRPVLYIDEENRINTLKTRLTKLVNGLNIDEEKLENLSFLIESGVKLDDEDLANSLLDKIQEKRPALIIFDSLIRFFNGEENSSKDVKVVFDVMKRIIKENDSAIIILHHTRKDSHANKHSLRGSGDLSAFCDSVLMIQKRNDYNFIIRQVKNRHQKETEPFDFTIKEEFNALMINYGSTITSTDVMSKVKQEIINWINNEEIEEFQTNTALNVMQRRGFKRNAVYDALKDLSEEDLIKKIKYGHYKTKKGET